ncbi:SsrA-binding protein [candidate division TM6 bacterium RIFCSPHIGHO2_12_FULL_36_22]|nr:MAG: SsrA-binding protein [candidate division TM6 bacterium RIFCSPHIGHO2_12_FULL_36_22]
MKLITKNKKAYFDYEILETLEAGIVLTGDEVKSLRAGHVNMTGSYAQFSKGELFLIGTHISPYSHAYTKSEESTERSRKLLLHKREMMTLIGDMSKKGITLVPLKLYFSRGKIKLELGIAKHKKAAGKKKEKQERDIKRETARELKDSYKYK